jgi:cytochrome c oxidase subunit 2
MVVALVVSSAAATACGGSPSAGIPADAQIQAGSVVYRRYCSSCHGAKGGGNIGPALGGGAVVARYPDPATHRAIVVNGKGAMMPAWGKSLSPADIDAVVRFEREALGR